MDHHHREQSSFRSFPDPSSPARGRRSRPSPPFRVAAGAAPAFALLAVAAGARASELRDVALPETVSRAERIAVVEVLEPLQSASSCYVDYSFRYRVERTLRGALPAAEGVYVDTYPRGDVTVEQCPVSYSFDVYAGSVRPPFQRGQRLILFFGERVPQHAFEAAEQLGEVERLAGGAPPPAPVAPLPVPPPPTPAPAPAAPPAVDAVPVAPVAPTAAAAGPPVGAGGPTVLESEGRIVGEGDTELVFTSDEPGVAVVGAAAGATRTGGGPVACRTPCRVRVPNGSYLFRVGTREFNVAATGGEQTWEVREGNAAAVAAGEHLVYDGIGLLVGGGILVGAELGRDGGSETGLQAIIGYSLLGIGAASILIGAPLWALCGGSAEEVEGAGAGGTVGVGVVPGPVAYDPWTGRTAWGLVFAAGW